MTIIKGILKGIVLLFVLIILIAAGAFIYLTNGHPIKAANALKQGKVTAVMFENSPNIKNSASKFGIITEINSDSIVIKKVTDKTTFKAPIKEYTLVQYFKELDNKKAPETDTYKERRKLLKLGQYVQYDPQTKDGWIIIRDDVITN